MRFILGFVFLVIISPLAIGLIFAIIDPKESFLFGRRWQFKGEVEPSETVLKLNRIISVICLILLVVGYVAAIVNLKL